MALSYYELLHKDDDEEKEKTKVKSFDDLSLRERTMLRYRTLSQNDLFDQREQAKKVAEAELDNIYKRYGKDRNTLTDMYTDFSNRTSDNYIDNYKNNYIAQSIADKLKSESNILTNTSDFAEGTYLGAKGFVSSSLDAGKQAELMVGGVLGGNLNADKLTKISQGKLGKDDPEYAKLSELYAKYGNNEKVAELYDVVTNTKKHYIAPIEIQRLTDSVNEIRRADEYKLWKNTYTADDDYDLQRYYTKNELSYDDGIGKALNTAAPVVGNILIPGALGAAVGSAVGSTNAIRSMKAAGDIAKASQIVRNVNTAVSLASMGPGVRGTAFNQAINDGANTNEAFVYSILSEALELGTELLGGEKVNALLGQTVATTPMGKLTNKLINKANIKNNAARMMISWISNIKAEAMEEKISAVLEPIIAAGTYGKEMPSPAEYIEGIYTSGLESVIPTMILGGFGQVRINHSINKIQQDMTNLITNDPRVSMHLTDAEKTELIKKLNFISENAKLGIEQNYDELENEVKSEAKAKGYDEQLYEIEQAIGEKVKTNANRINNLQQVYNQGENGEYVLTEDERAKALEFLVENNRLPTTNTTFKTAQELLDQEKRGTVTYKNIDAINQELAKVRAENPDITNIEAVTELSKIDENIKSLIDYYLNGKGETVFVNPTANGETIYGFTDRGTQNVYIDINQSTKDKIATAWHEIGHQLKLRVPELYNEFIDKAKITDNEITRYNNQLSKPKSKEEVLEEMFGDYLGKLLSSKENSNKLEDNAMSLVEKIKEIGGKLSNKVTGSEVDNSRLSVYNLDIGSYLDADILNDKELENKVFETLKSLKNVNQAKEATKVTEEITKNRPKPTMETAKKKQTDDTMSRIKERYEKIKKSGGGMELVKRMIAEELGVDRKKASAKINEIYDELTGETKYSERTRFSKRKGKAEENTSKEEEKNALKDKLRKLVARVQEEYSNVEGLSKEEAEQYIKLNKEASDIIYNLEKNYYKDISEKNIKDERLTSLDKNVYVQARKDLLSNKDIYDAIEEASFGVFLNSDTPVDAIMEGKNKEVTAEELYNTFNKTRELLRKQYGDTITLYRVEGLQKSKATKNYGSSLAYTKQYGSNVKPYNIKVKDIIAINTNRSGTYEDIIVANNGIDNYLKKNQTSNPDTRYSSRKNNDNLSWVPKKYQERVEGLTIGEDLSDEMPYLLELAKGWGLYERNNTSIPVNSKKEALQFIKEAEYFGEETPKKQPWKGQKKTETSKNRVLPKPVAQEDIINNQRNEIAKQTSKAETLKATNKGLRKENKELTKQLKKDNRSYTRAVKVKGAKIERLNNANEKKGHEIKRVNATNKVMEATYRGRIQELINESNKMLKTGRETELKMKGQLERAGKKYGKLSQLALDIKYEEQLERKSRADGINFPREYKDLFVGLRNTKMSIQEAYDLTKDIYEESQAVNKSIDNSIKILRELRKSKVYNKIPNELKARIDEYEKIWSGSRQQSDLTLAKRVLNSLEARELLGTVPISKAVRKQIMSMEGYGWESGKGSVSLQELFNGSKELALRFEQELKQLQEDVEKEMARNRRAERAKELSTQVEKITNEIQDVINEKSSSKLSNLRKDNNIPVAALMTLKTEIQALMGGNINTSLMFLNDSLQNAEIRQKTATVDVYEILSEFMQDSKGLNKLIHSEKWRTDLEKTLSRKADYVDTGITIKGQPLKIPTSMIMSLYMHSLNDDNMMHITGGIVSITTDDEGNTTTKPGKGEGIVIPNEALYKSGKVDQAYDKGRRVTLTPEQVNKIISKLTPEQKAFCEGVKEVFKYTTDLINTVSRKVLGYDIATVENYFPLVVWERAEHKSDTPQTSLDTQPTIEPLDYMLGAGWLQERVTSFAAIKLENIAEVLNRVVNKATAFYGYAEAFRDNSIILDTFNEDGWKTNKYGEPTQTLKKAISNLGSNFLRDYYTLADFITGRKSLAEEGKLRGLMAANTLTFNIGTWLTQPMSFFNTLKYFNTKEFAQSVMPHNNHIKLNNMIRDYYKELGIDKSNVSDFELAREFIALATPSLERRGIGFRKPLMTQLFNKTLSDRIGAKGISLFDDIAVTAIARMTAYSLSLDPTLKFGSDEYFKQLGAKLSQILVETQPETSQVNRANMFRKGGIWQGLTLFGTPANQIFNNFLQSAMDMNYQRTHGNKESIEKARNSLIKSVVGIIASSYSVAWIRALREAFRAGDDDDVELQDRVLAQFIVSLLSPTVVGDEIATWLLAKQKFGGTSFYDFTTPDTNYVQRLYNVADKVYAMMFNDNISPTKKTTDIIKALGSVTPIDTRSLMRIFEGVYKTIAPDEYKTYSLSQNNDAYKAYLKHSDTDMATFLKAYDATRTKTLEAKYGYHKADKAKGIKSNLKECREKALKDVLKDQSEVDKYMEILFGYKK